MRTVVTGGAGFIGSTAVDALLAGGATVLAIDSLTTGAEQNLAAAKQRAGDRLQFLQADICDRQTGAAVERFKPELVVHFAAQMNVRRSVAEPDYDAQSNVVGSVQMLEAAQRAGAKKFVFASTGGAIYGEQSEFPATESHPMSPKCPYGVSKRAGELYLEYYATHGSLQTISLRFANVYGPRQNPKGEAGVVAIFTERLLAGETLTVYGDGNQTRDFIHVDDVVSAVLTAARTDLVDRFSVFNIGRGVETSVNDVVSVLEAVWSEVAPERRDSFRVQYAPPLPGEQLRSVVSPEKAGRVLGWTPKVLLPEGLRQTVRSFVM